MSLIHFSTTQTSEQKILALRKILEENDFTASGIRRAFGVRNKYQINLLDIPTSSYFAQHLDSGLSILFLLFILEEEMPRSKILKFFGHRELNIFQQLNLLSISKRSVRARVSLEPVEDLIIATDLRYTGRPERKNDVYYIGLDTIFLRSAIPKQKLNKLKTSRILDICTGSGIQSLLLSKYCNSTLGIDINPRALNFARFNALLNGKKNVKFVLGDLFNAANRERFDLIVANPPFVPAVEAPLLYACVKDLGPNKALEDVIKGVPLHLQEGGEAFIVSFILGSGSVPFGKKIRQLPVDIFELQLAEWDIYNYTRSRIFPQRKSFNFGACYQKAGRLMDYFNKHRINSIRYSIFHVRRARKFFYCRETLSRKLTGPSAKIANRIAGRFRQKT
ncbi:MAG: methyltransferase [Candidatus Margulisbacteria bacterium]|nr:methyltransferase [Candidatus Margulisiibacteriota bacterium]